jgi:L-ascorbate metabolism protein UlaG (beta-lactamase superfamily)
MRITKYPQSCLVVEVEGARLAIDPGTLVTARYDVADLGPLDAVLYTHRHHDHLDVEVVDRLLGDGVTLFGNEDVVALLGGARCTLVQSGRGVTVAGVPVVPHDLPHAVMVDGSPGPPNTGFVVAGTLFHPGDGVELSGLTVSAAAIPIAGPSISFRDAYRFVQQLGADHVIPIHYEVFAADPDHFARVCDLAAVHVLTDTQSIELPSA